MMHNKTLQVSFSFIIQLCINARGNFKTSEIVKVLIILSLQDCYFNYCFKRD